MRSLVVLLTSFGSQRATRNARAEIELAESRQRQAAAVVGRVGSIDAMAGRPHPSELAAPSAA